MSRPRIRSIKPEMWQDEAFSTLSVQARLLFVGLITMADDEGRLRALPAAIIGHVFPYDNVSTTKLEGWLRELAESRLAIPYEVAGHWYVVLRSWHRHQKINRPSDSMLPAPPREAFVNTHGEISEPSVNGSGLVH